MPLKKIKMTVSPAPTFDKERYLERVEASLDYVVARFSRGNVNIQENRYHTAETFEDLKEKGRKAIEELLADI